MRFSLDTALLFFALAANTLAGPVNPKENHQVKPPLLKRATDGFHKSAVRHSAGLARDLRIAFRGLGRAHSTRAHLVGRGNTGDKPYCVSNPADSPQPQSNASAISPAHSSPSVTKKGSPSSTQSPATGPSSTAQSNFHVVQSYVRINRFGSAPPAREGITLTRFVFRSLEARSSLDGTSSPEMIQRMGTCNLLTSRLRCV